MLILIELLHPILHHYAPFLDAIFHALPAIDWSTHNARR